MKMYTWLLTSLVAAVIVLAGCSKSGTNVDPSPIEKSFASADATLKSAADKVVAAIKSADYTSATTELQKLASNVKLTEQQKHAIDDVLAQIQKVVANMGNKASGDANKALGDMQKSLGK